MKRIITIIAVCICIFACSPNIIFAAQDNLFTFDAVSNNKTQNTNHAISDAVLYGKTSLSSGISGNSLYFDGINSYVALPKENSIQSLSRMSFSVWIKPKLESTSGEMPILYCDGVFSLALDNVTNKIKLMLATSTSNELSSAYSLENDKWHHITVTYDGNSLCLYMNGKLDSSINTSGKITSSNSYIYVGTNGSSYYRGNIDEVAFFENALSTIQVGEMYHSYIDVITDWNYVSFPLKSSFPHGIESASASLFKNSKIHKPINTGFEERNEINAISADNKNNQLKIVEDKYTGKFALKIHALDSNILPLKETQYFATTDSLPRNTYTTTQNEVGISISTDNKSVTVTGTRNPQEMISLLVKKETSISYVDQTKTDALGCFSFHFDLTEYGNYTLCIGGTQSEAYWTSFTLAGEGNSLPPSMETEAVSVKCNFYSIMIKPMFQAESISFYVKTKGTDASENQTEEYILIKSDHDGNGIFKVGEDLSRGKWQKIELNLADIDAALQNRQASGLYMSANIGSEWIFDDIDSGYKKINQSNMELSQFAKNNVVYINNTLRFANADNSENANFDTNEAVVTGELNISEKLSEITVETEKAYANAENQETTTTQQVLISEPLSSSAWSVNDTDYDTSETGVSKKTAKVYLRDNVPELSPYTIKTTIEINALAEKRFRLKIGPGSTSGVTLTITDNNGKEQYVSLNSIFYTGWYDGDITIKSPGSSYPLQSILKIYAIEYESITDTTEKEIIMKNNGTATIDLGNKTTSDRTKLVLNVSGHKKVGSGLLKLELFEGEELYYSSYIRATLNLATKELEHIIPKIKPNTKIKITNQLAETSGDQADEVRLTDFKIMSLIEQDWNKEKENLYTISSKKYFFNDLQNTYGSKNYTFNFKWADEVYDESNKYALVHPNAGGLLNTAGKDQVFVAGGSEKVILRIMNLSQTPTYITDYHNNTIYLQYGECDYIITAYDRFSISSNPNVILVSVSNIGTIENKNHLYYTAVDGLGSVYDVTEDGNKVFYAHASEKNALYAYDFNAKSYKKVYDEQVKEITTNSNGKYVVIKDSNNTYLLIETETGKITTLPTELGEDCAFYFSPQNQLFIIKGYEYTGVGLSYRQAFYLFENNELIDLLQNENNYFSGQAKRTLSFDKTGDYMLVSNNQMLFKKVNGVWNKIDTFSISNGYLSSDATTIYTSNSIIDVNTKTSKALPTGYNLIGKTSNDLLLLESDNYYYLYNPITEEKNKILDNPIENISNPAFYSEQNLFMAHTMSNGFVRHYYTDEKPELKYALSFDGKDNWYSYTGGRWKLLSKDKEPSVNEMQTLGMTEEEINSIPATAYNTLYQDGTDIVTVDMAIYMHSPLNNQTPVIKQITVNTQDNNELNGLYGINLEKYDKDEYRTVSSLFPIENFSGDAECYYLLYLGNDWLYTYKNNKLVKVVESADELLSDIGTSWITFKQYGMTAKEVRSIPSDVINGLFVNDNYANTEFGVIYVVKTDSDDTSGYTVNFRLKSESNFIAEDDVVIEIVMNGGDIKVIDSKEFSKKDIENLLSWIEARQSGTGDIFYRIKNDKVQYFINYYMINGINVYNGTEYRESHSQNTATR